MLNRPLLAASMVAAIVVSGRTAALPSADSLVEELLQRRIERQVETDVLDQVERSVEGAIERTLDEAERVAERAAPTASDALAGITEVLPPPGEQFQPDLDRDGRTVERGAWLVLADRAQAERLAADGFSVRELRRLDALDRVLLRIEGQEEPEALLALGIEVDRNHVYAPVSEGTGVSSPAGSTASTARGLSVGMVDTAVAVRHEAFRRAAIEQRSFVPYRAPRPTAHGTAVASILVGEGPALRPALPGARLRAASVFFEDDTGSSIATAASLVQALDWLAGSGVRVINMSLAGPPNRVLEAAIQGVAAKGIVVVAAVGNNGPAGEPLYPAAYATVVGITAVDSADRVYVRAGRGRHVAFAAPGVAVEVARAEGGYEAESGTSMAAPIAAAILARALAAPGSSPASVLRAARATAIDLGEPGFDETYGHGRISASGPR